MQSCFFCYSYWLASNVNSNIFCILPLICASRGVAVLFLYGSNQCLLLSRYETESYIKMANRIKLL